MKKKNPIKLYEPQLITSKYKFKHRRPIYKGGGYKYDTWVVRTTLLVHKASHRGSSFNAFNNVSEVGFRICRTTKDDKE